MNQSAMRASRLCSAMVIALGCSFALHAQSSDGPVGTTSQPLTIKNVRNWTENGNVVPVCWETLGYDREKAIIVAALKRTWERAANIKFVGWNVCPTGAGIFGSGSERAVRVRISPHDATDAGAGGQAAYGMDSLSSANDNNPGVRLSFNPDGTADKGRVEYIGVHEFGHVLGFVHEQDTPGNVEGPAHCASPGNESNATSLTPYDRDSIMNYCNKDGNMQGNLTPTDVAGVQAVYGRPYLSLGRAHVAKSPQITDPVTHVATDYTDSRESASILTPKHDSTAALPVPHSRFDSARAAVNAPASAARTDIVSQQHPTRSIVFSPPRFDDGARVWACDGGIEAKAHGGACNGASAGTMFCRSRGYRSVLTRGDGSAVLNVDTAQAGVPVHARNGDACTVAGCPVIVQLGCNP